MNWFESLIFGLVSGITEFLPISSQAHERLLMHMFGIQAHDPVRSLLVHFAMLFALYTGCRSMFEYLKRERNQRIHNRRRNSHTARILLDERFTKNAAVPMLVGMLALSYIFSTDTNLMAAAIFFLINGLILFASGRMLQGNKDVRSMSYLDSLIIGLFGSLSAFSGISRVACITSSAIARGADRQNALNWAYLLSVPALLLLIGLDLLQIFSGASTIPFWSNFFSYLISAVCTFVAGRCGIKLMKFLTVRVGFSGFAYYCWGASLFSFLLFLTVA